MKVPPDTQYAEGPDGLIAYQVLGDGPLDLVYLTGSTSHVDVRWESPTQRYFHERLAAFSRLIIFDRMGTGASDPVPTDRFPSWEQWADEFGIVMDAVGSERAGLFAVLDAGPMAMIFAAMHPERVSALALGNTTAKLTRSDDYPHGRSAEEWLATISRLREPGGSEAISEASNPTAWQDPAERAWLLKYVRASGSPRMALAHQTAAGEMDVRAVLPSIQAPTLVMHRRAAGYTDVGHGRYLAQHIPGARLLALEGADSSLAYGDVDKVLEALEEHFTGARSVREPDRILATVLFTDIVDSTPRAAELGDRAWRFLLDRHDDVVRSGITRHGGRLLQTTGDGAVATFDRPGRAIRCAVEIRELLKDLDLPVRAGLHSGELELHGDDLRGIAMHIAARVSARAGAGEVLVSSTVRDLVVGSGIDFDDRGEHELKVFRELGASTPCATDSARIVQCRHQSWWRHRTVGIRDDLGDLGPVDGHVEVDAEPAAAADVRRPEVVLRGRRDERLLDPGWRCAPEPEPVVVMVVGVRDERLLVPDEPGRLAVAQPLRRLRHG